MRSGQCRPQSFGSSASRVSFPHFRRLHEHHVELATFQLTSTVEALLSKSRGLTQEQVWTLILEWQSVVSAPPTHKTQAIGIVGRIGHGDHWFNFGTGNMILYRRHTSCQSETVYTAFAQAELQLAADRRASDTGGRPTLSSDDVPTASPYTIVT